MIPIKTIHYAVCSYYNIPIDLPFKKGRKNQVKYRQIIQYLSKKLNNQIPNGSHEFLSLEKIGRYYSEYTGIVYDHATVRHSVKKIQGFIESYENYSMEINNIIKIIKTLSVSKSLSFSEEKLIVINLVFLSENSTDLKSRLIKYVNNE